MFISNSAAICDHPFVKLGFWSFPRYLACVLSLSQASMPLQVWGHFRIRFRYATPSWPGKRRFRCPWLLLTVPLDDLQEVLPLVFVLCKVEVEGVAICVEG